MAKKGRRRSQPQASPFNLAGNQLTLFDISQFEGARSHYDIEDGDEDEDWPPQPVSESIEEFVSESIEEFVSESIEEFVSESIWPPELIDDSLTTDPINDSLTSIDAEELTPCGAIGKYRAGGNTRGGGEYWRFSYRVGKRVKHVHIPGGCATSAIATKRAAQVREAVTFGATVEEVLDLIGSWTRKHQ